MSPKKRVYELAKEYGMSGQDLAAKLRDLGFAQIKSHMAAMDDFLLLQVQGVLEAHGLIAESGGKGGAGGADGLVVKKKKKKRKKETEAAAPEPAVEEPAAPEEAVEPPSEPAPVEPEPAEDPPLEPVVEAPAIPDELLPEVEEIEPEPAPAAAEEPEEAPPETAEAPAVEPTVAEVEQAEPVAEEKAAPAEQEGAPAAPAKRGPAGKVVGFVDLSQFATPAPRRPESRRLSSRDDVAPDVRPTLGHDRRKAFMRGDQGSRDRLTAGQLREKEAARFLRRRALGGGPGARNQSRSPRSHETLGSPYSGNVLRIESPLTIKKLAEGLAIKTGQLLNKAIGAMGFGVNLNTSLDEETAVLLAQEFSVQLEVVHEVAAEQALLEHLGTQRQEVEEEKLGVRPPVVAFLGHVDHGKTTLLDSIRKSRVVHGESGGITQHLGAYRVKTQKRHPLTIIDTPGHQAFSRMRARGAEAVDIVVLVVAADDGVMPSTIEAINHTRATKKETPIVVALNKMDKPEANPDKVLTELAAQGLQPEEWGGETAVMRLSALKGDGIEELLERVFLEGEVRELRAHSEGPGAGVVLEAEVQEGKGRVAYLLVQDGTLKQGDIILAGEGYGRVRSIHDDRGKLLKTAGPSTPVEVSGLSELPGVGDAFHVVPKLEQAREVAEERARKNRAEAIPEKRQLATVDTLAQTVAEQSKNTINVILKADVQGSLEALRPQLESLTHEEIEVRLLHAGLGTVTESDVDLGRSSEGMVIAFHVGVNGKARQLADRSGVEIRRYEVIYELLDELREMMEGKLAPEMTEEITGHVEVRRVFKSSRLGNIAGSFVLDGSIFRDNRVRVRRGDKVVHEGPIGSLRRIKDDVKEVREGFECGIVLRGFDGYEEGDVLEAYRMVAVKRLLEI